jgi:hypothetical protein
METPTKIIPEVDAWNPDTRNRVSRELQEMVDFLRVWRRECRAKTEEFEAKTEEMKRQEEEEKAGTGRTSRPSGITLESIHRELVALRHEVAQMRGR